MTESQTVQQSQDVEWLTPTPGGKQPCYVRNDDDPWHIIPHWAMVDGAAILVGLDIRCFVERNSPDGTVEREPVGDRLHELTQKVLRGIAISAVRKESSAAVAGSLAEISAAAPGSVLGMYVDGITDSLTAAGTPRQRRRPASDDHLRLVAALYAEAPASGQHRTPARYVEQQLRQRGVPVSARGGRDQVRKWIQRARERDFIPPV